MTPKVFMLADKPTYMLDREGRALDMGTWYNEMFRRMACDFAAVLTNRAGIFVDADTVINQYAKYQGGLSVFEEVLASEGADREELLRSPFREKILQFAFPGRDCGAECDDTWLERIRRANRWIPVNEALPEKNQDILVTVRENGYEYVKTSRFHGVSVWEYEKTQGKETLAWMALPEAYRAEE